MSLSPSERPTHVVAVMQGSRPEPFIEFPLWGLRQALGDHEARCSACSGNLTAECVDDWYARMLRAKIARLSR